MAIEYSELSEINKSNLTDLLSKREAIDSALADIQTERATSESARSVKEQELQAEQNRLTEDMRKMRKATQT